MNELDKKWLQGYVSEARFIHSLGPRDSTGRFIKGWAHAKKIVKQNIRFFARPYLSTMGMAQKGMVDALLDSVN